VRDFLTYSLHEQQELQQGFEGLYRSRKHCNKSCTPNMAKSARASTRKRNNAALRSKIFGPAHDARTQRLSAKLQELVSQPKPLEDKATEVDATGRGEAKEQESISDANIVDGMLF
jgi:Protein of unknown function (DUF2423)